MSSLLGRYTLHELIGAGGMAEVWLASISGPAGFEKRLAIKKILPRFLDETDKIDMFIREAKLVAELVHPNIVQVFDFGNVGDEYFIAMEYVPGANLGALAYRARKQGVHLPAEAIAYVAIEACRALAYAHDKTDRNGVSMGIVHRDVSPHNILISFDGDVKLADFGIAKVTSKVQVVTRDGEIKGKFAYLTPEQVRAHPVDRRTDIFILGIVLYELLSKERLFASGTIADIVVRVSAFRGLSENQLGLIPIELRKVVQTCLQPDPKLRYQSAQQMEAALAASFGGANLGTRTALAAIVQLLFPPDAAPPIFQAERSITLASQGTRFEATPPEPDDATIDYPPKKRR